MHQVILAVCLVVVPPTLFADGIVNTCQNGTLQDYLNLGKSGCILDDKQFTDFQQPFVGDFATGLKTKALPFFPENVAVMIIDTPADPGFVFDFGNATFPSGTGVEGTVITFAIRVLPGGLSMIGASLSINAMADGAGAAEAVENLNCGTETGPCHTGGATGGSDQLIGQVCLPGTCGGGFLSETAPFPNAKQVFVLDQFFVDSVHGDVTLSTVTEQFQEGPEPSSVILLVTAVAGAVLIRRSQYRGCAREQRG